MIFLTHILAAAEEPSGIATLGLDPWAILAQATTFLVLFWVVKKFALGKIVHTLDTRRKTIEKGVLLGIEMQSEKEKLDKTVSEALHRAREQADQLLANAQAEGKQIVKEATDEASQKAKQLIEEASQKLQTDVEKVRHELKTELAGLVADATEIVVGEKLDTSKDNALIQKALQGAEK